MSKRISKNEAASYSEHLHCIAVIKYGYADILPFIPPLELPARPLKSLCAFQ